MKKDFRVKAMKLALFRLCAGRGAAKIAKMPRSPRRFWKMGFSDISCFGNGVALFRLAQYKGTAKIARKPGPPKLFRFMAYTTEFQYLRAGQYSNIRLFSTFGMLIFDTYHRRKTICGTINRIEYRASYYYEFIKRIRPIVIGAYQYFLMIILLSADRCSSQNRRRT